MANHGNRNKRDSQRQRVYNAEDIAFPIMQAWSNYGIGDTFTSIHETQAFVDKIAKSAWWKKRTDIIQVEVSDGRGRRSACAYGITYLWVGGNKAIGFGKIALPKGNRNINSVLHEFAHLLAHDDDFAAHGPEFCKAYLALVKRFLGKQSHSNLKYGFDRMKVNYRTGWEVKQFYV